MKKVLAAAFCFFLLTGCADTEDGIGQALQLRQKVLENGCGFQAEITADYGDEIYTFAMECAADANGHVSFTVTEPESISGIAGTVSQEGGKLTFDDTVLAFPLLADGQVSPVSAPWLLVKTLRGGYIASCAQEDDLWKLAIDDSYEEDSLRLDIWLDDQCIPMRAEILYGGKRIVSMDVENFTFG